MSAAPSDAELVAFAPKPVDVDAIEHELTELWRGQATGAQETVTRACMSNLLIFCATQEEARGIAQEVASVVQEHPARVLLFVEDAQRPSSEIEAYVSAQCYLAGGGRQICSEHVMVNAGPGASRRLPSVARPLLIGDLPTALWWATAEAPPLRGQLFDEFAAMTNQVIYDSCAWQDAARGVVATGDWVRGGETRQVIADLAWRRIKPWRRLISQSFDPTAAPGAALESIREVVVEHGPHALPEAWLLIGWLACCLGWRPAGGKVAAGVDLAWAFQTPHGPIGVTVRRLSDGDAALRNVSIEWSGGASSGTLRASVLGAGRLGVRMNGSTEPARIIAHPPRSRAALLARQLPALSRDSLFLDTLELARIMAKALL